MATLPAIPVSYTTSGKTDFRVLEAPFGDGYSQRAADGLNSVRRTWNVVWTARPDADIDSLYDFLVALLGYEKFQWTAPDESTERDWVCKDPITKTPITAGYSTLRATFEEVFDL
jgi:phage-related protein